MSLWASDLHRERIDLLIERLGYARDEDFVRRAEQLELSQVSHAVESAFASMGVVGALCLSSRLASGQARRVPVVYLVSALDGKDADARHRAIWSQSVAPVVLIATPDFVQVRNGFHPQAKGPEFGWETLSAEVLPKALVSLTSSNVRSAASWQSFGGVEIRVDERLGKAIEALSIDIRANDPRLASRADAINSVIGRFLYLYMLVDRGILDQKWVDGLRRDDGERACPNIRLHEGWAAGEARPAQWSSAEIWFLFDAIDEVLNGSIFPLPKSQRHLFDDVALHLIRRALRADTLKDGKQQYGFLDVDYATIRTETVSSIYECFFELEAGGGKADQGAYYTPSFVVDYILDEIDAIAPLTAASRVMDPACGSGAFLVGAFRRIVEGERRQGRKPDPLRLREILETTVMGIELKPQAANVARFSLYLTMLDYMPGVTLNSVRAETRGARLFPNLEDRIVAGDTFRALPVAMRGMATHVLGNPPWTKIEAGDTSASAYRARLLSAVGEDETQFMANDGPMAEAFFWRAARDICRSDGQIAFVMPTKSFIAPMAKWFPCALASRTTLNGITNLAHFREHLFTNARAAATVIFASPAAPPALNRAWRYSPKPTSQPIGRDGMPWAIVVDRGQVEHFVQTDLLTRHHKWFRDLMLQPLDRMIASMLEQHPAPPPPKVRAGKRIKTLANGELAEPAAEARPLLNLGGFLKRTGMEILVGDSASRIGLPNDLVLNTKANDFRLRLGLTDGLEGDYHLSEDLLDGLRGRYRRLFRGPMILMTRNQSGLYLIDQPVAFSSSIQGLHFETDVVPSEQRLAVLTEIAAYLRTSVGRYLLALFGRLWVFDQRRIETPDLRSMPFPFRTVEDLLLHRPSVMDDEAFTRFCRDAFDLDDDLFELAVAEHHELREAYQDGRRPALAASAPGDVVHLNYGRVLEHQLSDMLASSDLNIVIDMTKVTSSNLVRVFVGAGDHDMPLDAPLCIDREFSPEAGIMMQDVGDTLIADVIKPRMRSAWTVERAYADALALAERIMAA
ncbi:DNA methyltransferase [Sphingomonas oryzagri]